MAATTTQYDYSIEDAKDDTGVVDDKDIAGDDDEVWHYNLDNIPSEAEASFRQWNGITVPIHRPEFPQVYE